MFVKTDTQIDYHGDGTATVTKDSLITRKRSSMRMALTKEQFESWQGGGLIQNVLPHLTAIEREFLMTGITSEEWNKEFSDDE